MKKFIIIFFLFIVLATFGSFFAFYFLIGFDTSGPQASNIKYKKNDKSNYVVFDLTQKKKHDGFCIEIGSDDEFVTNTKVEFIESDAENIEFKSKGWKFKDGDTIYIRVSSWIDIEEKKEFSNYNRYSYLVRK